MFNQGLHDQLSEEIKNDNFNQVNLFIGKNSSGKSQTLKILKNIYKQTTKKDELYYLNLSEFNPKSIYINLFDIRYEKANKTILNDLNRLGFDIPNVYPQGNSITNFIFSNGANFFFYKTYRSYGNEWDAVHTPTLNLSEKVIKAFFITIITNQIISTNNNSVIMIDDFGEGLDFENSKTLTDIFIEKFKNTNSKLFISTNNPFVMNEIPIENLQVIHREKENFQIFNRKNSTKIFNDFEFTGLNNFDLLKSEFYKTGYSNEN